MRRVSLCTAEASLAILDFADHLVHLMRPVSLKATGGKQVFPSVTTPIPMKLLTCNSIMSKSRLGMSVLKDAARSMTMSLDPLFMI